MFFSGLTFSSGKYSLNSPSPIPGREIKSVQIMNGVFDDLYITRDSNMPYSNEIQDIWDHNTALYAKFQGNLFSGNSEYTVSNTDYLKIKRRKKGTMDWVCIFRIPVRAPKDFIFELFDYTARSNTAYEYCLVPVSGDVEGGFRINDIKTFFNGLFIVEKDKYFSTQIGAKITPLQQNRPSSVISTVGRKYPFIISNGSINYKSVSVSGVFAELIMNPCSIDYENSWEYRERLNNFLFNGIPKLVKYEDGRMYLAAVSSDTITENELNAEQFVETSFEITELGNCDNGIDLYDYGLIDVKEVNGVITSVNEIEEKLGQLAYEIENLKANKADNISYDTKKGTINLIADGEHIGDNVDLEGPLGRELYVLPIDQ